MTEKAAQSQVTDMMNVRRIERRPTLANREGFVLPVALFAMVVMSILAVTALRIAGDDQRSSRAVRESSLAFYAAEAGMAQVFGTWNVAAIIALAPADSIDTGWVTLANGATYRGVTRRYDDNGQPMFGIRVEGRGPPPFGGQRTLFTMITELQFFGWAMYGKDALDIGGGTIQGDVGSNGDLTFSGVGTLVNGNAIVGGTINDPTKVTGTAVQGADPMGFDDVACPATPYGPAAVGPGVSFNAGSGDLTIGGGDDATFPNGTYYYHDFKKSGSANMIVPAGATVEIYISGQLDVGGNGFINNNNDSSALRIWGCGPDTSDWTLTGNSDVYLTIYAPNHNLKLAGNGSKYGSFTGAALTKQGNGVVAFDLTAETGTGKYVSVAGSWTQLLN